MSKCPDTPQVDANGIYHYRGVQINETTHPSQFHRTRLWIVNYNPDETPCNEAVCPHFSSISHALVWIDNMLDDEPQETNKPSGQAKTEHRQG